MFQYAPESSLKVSRTTYPQTRDLKDCLKVRKELLIEFKVVENGPMPQFGKLIGKTSL